MPDNVGEMFYYGEIPWHKKGRPLLQPATAEEALRGGGLDWKVALIPLQTAEQPPSPVFRRMAVVRTDRESGHHSRVLGVVHHGFRPLQNQEGVKLFDALIGGGKRIYHTGGYLGNGEVVWLLARLPTEIRIRDNDVVEPYMLFTNSHDGSIAINFRLTTIRVVCQNTLSLALADPKTKLIFKRAHQGSYQALQAEAKQFFQFSLEATSALGNQFRDMTDVPLRVDAFQMFLEQLIPLPPPLLAPQTDERRRRLRETHARKVEATHTAMREVFTAGITNGFLVPAAEKTLWGALNTVTAFVDHRQAVDGDRYAHSLFGSGAVLKQKAYTLALSYLPEEERQAGLLN
jgi:phage/plasmid-like protein (TIGR03299 family)